MKFRLSAPDGSSEVNNPIKIITIIILMGAMMVWKPQGVYFLSNGYISYDASKLLTNLTS